MSKALETLTTKYGAQVVGGKIIAVIDSVHTELGFVNRGQPVLNDVGEALLKVAPLDHDGDRQRGGSVRGRRRQQAETVADETETETETETDLQVEQDA